MQYCVYKFTNMLDGKVYIGKSKRINRRYSEHINGWRWRTSGQKSYISKAIGKHGIDNFMFEIIGTYNTPEEMNEAETSFIEQYKSVYPNGYNFRIEKDDKYHVHDDTKKLLSRIGQGIRHAKKENIQSSYIGVILTSTGNYRACVRINTKIKTKTFKTEIEAAEAYDKMVLFIYGEDARINFPNKRDEFIAENLEEFYDKFLKSSIIKTSEYFGVSLNKKANKWCIKIHRGQTVYPNLELGLFDSDADAAKMVDKINFAFDLRRRFNFPEDIPYYNKADLLAFFKNKICTKQSKYTGVCKSSNNKWRAFFYINRKQISVGNCFPTEIDAYNARQQAISNLNLVE